MAEDLLNFDNTFSVADAAQRYQVSDRTIRRWVKQGHMPAHKLRGHFLRFTQEDFDTYDEASVVRL